METSPKRHGAKKIYSYSIKLNTRYWTRQERSDDCPKWFICPAQKKLPLSLSGKTCLKGKGVRNNDELRAEI